MQPRYGRRARDVGIRTIGSRLGGVASRARVTAGGGGDPAFAKATADALVTSWWGKRCRHSRMAVITGGSRLR